MRQVHSSLVLLLLLAILSGGVLFALRWPRPGPLELLNLSTPPRQPPLSLPGTALPQSPLMDKINVNRASQELLETLPGIGPAKAEAIIRYRERHGPFKALAELLKVPGIGEGTLARIQGLITLK